ncbi:hypothetical protein [Tenacibaculum sp. SG-28]|uniref:hypothetical protein n=1 Tax=Tenacibaculum sp. SG-28 TaxID=754426 RepID=UPI000CF546A8|nr:hypothetical protein [Tenacibaculum sp. SG-28]PQJ23483.1 hypothetical protein BSU00_04710 [Tenacibaculum sp. SG-28]
MKNHLNLPTRVTINNKHIDHTYDAIGVKLDEAKKAVSNFFERAKNLIINGPSGFVPKDA